MTTQLTLVASIQAHPGKESAVEGALRALVAPTLAERGCLQYDLHRDLQVPGLFHFFEIWATRGDWEAHNGSDHIAAMLQATKGQMAEPAISQMEKIDS